MTKQARKSGPRPKPPAELRNRNVNVKLTEDEKVLIEEKAEQMDETLSSWARGVLVKAARR